MCLRMYVSCHHKLMVWCALFHMSLKHCTESGKFQEEDDTCHIVISQDLKIG